MFFFVFLAGFAFYRIIFNKSIKSSQKLPKPVKIKELKGI